MESSSDCLAMSSCALTSRSCVPWLVISDCTLSSCCSVTHKPTVLSVPLMSDGSGTTSRQACHAQVIAESVYAALCVPQCFSACPSNISCHVLGSAADQMQWKDRTSARGVLFPTSCKAGQQQLVRMTAFKPKSCKPTKAM